MKKHVICFGDSNTHGYCADANDCADANLMRFNELERWPCLLQEKLGDSYKVFEEGLSGRTTVFEDPFQEGLCGLDYIAPCLKTHEPVSMLIVMLGTNDTKERFSASASCIALGMSRLVKKAALIDCWEGGRPNILIVSPPVIREGIMTSLASWTMGSGCVEKSRELASHYTEIATALKCNFMDASECEFNSIDFMHLTKIGHAQLAEKLVHKLSEIL